MSDAARNRIIEAMARAHDPVAWKWIDRVRVEDPSHLALATTVEDQLRRCRAALDAIGTLAAVVPQSATVLQLAAGWAAINEGRARPVDMAPGPALREAYPMMVAAGDMTQHLDEART